MLLYSSFQSRIYNPGANIPFLYKNTDLQNNNIFALLNVAVKGPLILNDVINMAATIESEILQKRL